MDVTPLDDLTFYDDIEGYCGKLSYRAGETMEQALSDVCKDIRCGR